MMKKSKYILLGKTIACVFLLVLTGLLFNLASLFGPAPIAVAAQPPDPTEAAPPTPLPRLDDLIIPNGAEVIVDELNLRRGPGRRFSVINVLQAGEVLTITNISPDLYWIEVLTSAGQAGWVSASPQYISLITHLDKQPVSAEPVSTPEPLPEVPPAQAVPILLSSRSLDGMELGLTQFVWRWDAPLAQNQGFEVRVWREGEASLGIHDAVSDNRAGKIEALGNNTYRLTIDLRDAPGIRGPGNYLWTVLIVQISPNYQELGIQAEPAPLGEDILPPPSPQLLLLPPPPSPNYATVKVFYGTNRNITGSRHPDRFYGVERSSLTYGIAEVSIPRDHQLGQLESPSIFSFEFREDPEKHVVLLSVQPQGDQAFFAALGSRIQASPKQQAFVFVHGYNVTFENAARQTAQIAYDLGFDGAPILYSWPSNGSIPAYWADEADALWSAPHLKTFLEEIARRTGAKTIHVIAHSMGNQALTNALKSMVTPGGHITSTVFKEIVLAAPDIGADDFTRDIAPQLISGFKRVTLYASAGDKALLLSTKIHQAVRAGYISENNPVILQGMDTIDTTGVDSSLLGHSYYAANCSVLSDIFYLLNKDIPISERSYLAKVESVKGIHWAFQTALCTNTLVK